MLSKKASEIRKTLKKKSVFTLIPLKARRIAWEKLMEKFPHPDHIIIQQKSINNINTEWLSCKNQNSNKVIIHLHGGGFVMGSCITHRNFASKIVDATNLTVILVDYSLAPEYPFPAALNDCFSIYKSLTENKIKPENIIIGGDSAGGGLTISLLLKIKEQNMQMPLCAYAISPWVDLTLSGESIIARKKHDPMVSKKGLKKDVKLYLKNTSPENPFASPIFGDFSGFSPLLIHVGKDEILLSESELLAAKAKNAGVNVKIEIWEDLWHVFHAYPIPEADEAIKKIAGFINNISNSI